MKTKITILSAVAFALFSVSASAQFVTSSSSSASASSAMSSFFVSYSPTNFETTYKNSSDVTSAKGVTAGFLWNTPIASVNNLSYEVGLAAQIMWNNPDIDVDDVTARETYIGAKVPLGLVYSVPVGTTLTIMPYAGVDPTIFLVGKYTASYEGSSSESKVEINYFDKKDMDNNQFSRFVLNWHIGARVLINSNFFAGVGYEAPIIGFFDKNGVKSSYNQTQLTVGFLF